MDNDSSARTQAARQHSSTSISADSLFSSGGPTSPKMPPPAEHIGAATSPMKSDFPQAGSARAHMRSKSLADVARQGKRLSLHFPIQTATDRTSPRASPRPQSWMNTPLTTPLSEVAPSPTTEGNFLTSLAAGERRVLELKEELRQAEEDLVRLKKEWASHEATKVRNDRSRVQQLQPLNTSLANLGTADDEDGSSAWLQKEMERRKAILSGIKSSHRKVFSGSRHTRALSLLSPDRLNYTPSFPQPLDVHQATEGPAKPQLTRASTTSDIATQAATPGDDAKLDLSVLQKEALLRTGKQMAADLKDGLWTFIEDLRQATVGDEAINGKQQLRPGQNGSNNRRTPGNTKPNKRPVSFAAPSSLSGSHQSSSNRLSDDLIDIGGSFWKEHGLDEPASSTSSKPKKPVKSSKSASGAGNQQKTPQKSVKDFEDSWDTWDTPNEKYAGVSSSDTSESDGRTSPGSSTSSPRTSTSSTRPEPSEPNTPGSKRDSIPWPAIVKLSPSNLKRTASHLMAEWERSLTATPEPEALQAAAAYATPKPKKGD